MNRTCMERSRASRSAARRRSGSRTSRGGSGEAGGRVALGRTGALNLAAAPPCLCSPGWQAGPCWQPRPRRGVSEEEEVMLNVSVRYFVDAMDAAVAFYTQGLGFSLTARPAPTFAILTRGNLRLLLNTTDGPGGASQPMPDGRRPQPGGWNRIQLEVEDLEAEVDRLRGAGAHFRNTIVQGFGGKQCLLEDPAGNPIELFEPPRR